MDLGPFSFEDLEAHEGELVFESFSNADAWQVGSWLVERATKDGLGVTIDIRRGDWVVFRAALPGATADNIEWVRKKSAVAQRFEASSLLVSARLERDDLDPFAMGWLTREDYTLAGGAVPIRVRDTGVVAVLTVSGLTAVDDHALAVDAIRAHCQ